MQTSIDIGGVSFLFNQIPNTFKDTFRADFALAQADKINNENYATVMFKIFNTKNFYLLEAYLSQSNESLDDATKLSKEQFAQKYPDYFSKLNKAIITFLDMNH